jgi:hypothetical protein
MRFFGMLGAIALLIAGVPAVEPAGATTLATHRVTIHPVTSTGHVSASFTLHAEPGQSVDCSARTPSPGAVSPNIEFCSPSAEYAIACWNAAAAQRALCIRDPRTKNVYRIPRTGTFAPTPVAPVVFRAPLMMMLTNGDVCAIRDGGAGGSLTGHPNLFQTYFCLGSAGTEEVWASTSARHFGVNEAHSLWTVQTAPAGNHALVTRHVAEAWFVATQSV